MDRGVSKAAARQANLLAQPQSDAAGRDANSVVAALTRFLVREFQKPASIFQPFPIEIVPELEEGRYRNVT